MDVLFKHFYEANGGLAVSRNGLASPAFQLGISLGDRFRKKNLLVPDAFSVLFIKLFSRNKTAEIMRKSNPHTKNRKSNIQCLEVLIPKSFIVSSAHNLHWTLSVYSLENQPVKKNRSIHNSEVFHFMVYDWKRTIKQLLEVQKIPYSIIQYFSPETIYTDAMDGHSMELLASLESIPDSSEEMKKQRIEMFSRISTAELILEGRTH